MSLDAFFSQPESMSQAELARQLGVSRKTVHAWVKGYNQVPGPMARKIIEITGGQVTYEGIYGKPALQGTEGSCEERIGG